MTIDFRGDGLEDKFVKTSYGGYYLDTKINGEGCEYVTSAHAKSYYDYSTGFRCCADPR